MGSLVRRITDLSLAGYGINIFEDTAPQQVSGVSPTSVGIIGDFPWGEPNVVTRITSFAELFAAFCPLPFDVADDYPAMKAFLNKSFPGGIDVVRIDATSAAKAESAAITAGSGTITFKAKWKGASGNLIKYQIAAATDANSAHRNVVITVGTLYSATYENLAFGDFAGIDDPYVDVVDASATAVPATGSATSLGAGVSGSDGTAVAGDYVGSISSNVGIRMFYADALQEACIFVAECPDGLIDTVNTGLEAYANEAAKGIAVLCTPHGDSASAAITDVASYRGDRIKYCYPRVKTTDGYDPNQAEVTVDGNAFYAAALASISPFKSVGGKDGAEFLTGITGLENETLTRTNLDDLNAAGIGPFQITSELGVIIRKDVTTSLTAGEEKIQRRRSADYIELSMGEFAANFAEVPLDVSLSAQALGPNTQPLIGSFNTFLGGLFAQGLIDAIPGAAKPFVVDPFSGNTQSDIDDGHWTIITRVKLFNSADVIILRNEIGSTVA